MKLLLNGNEINDIATDQDSLGEILKNIQDSQVAHDAVISGIWIDGEPLTADLLSQWKDRPASDFAETRIDAPHRNALAAQGMRTLSCGLAESKDERHQIVEHLHQGRSTEAMKILPGYLELWHNIHQSLASACRLLNVEMDSLEIFSPTTAQTATDPHNCDRLTDRSAHLIQILGQLKQALESADLVLLADIIDYEFADLTSDWQTLLDELANRFDVPN